MIITRPRRNRKSENLRRLVRETNLSRADLIQPLFVIEAKGAKEEISSLPGQFRLGPDLLVKEVKELHEKSQLKD